VIYRSIALIPPDRYRIHSSDDSYRFLRPACHGAFEALIHNFQLTELRLNLKNTSDPEDSAGSNKVAFAALHHRDFRVYFIGTMLAMMADNIEHVISYWVL